jgi:glycosyltransferase involved in cell wall biosynthesis
MFLFHHLRVFCFALRLLIRFRPEVIVAEGYFLSFLIGLMKPSGLYKRSVYISGDWLEGSKRKSNLLGYAANNLFFPVIDLIACRLSYSVFNVSQEIGKKRRNYWNKQVAHIEKVIYFPLAPQWQEGDLDSRRKNICYLGIMRDDCGLDIAIRSLKRLREYEDFHIKVIGAYSYEYENLKRLAEEFEVADFVHFLGFVKREEFKSLLADCFCGLHLLKIPDAYNAFSFPSKLGDYLRYLLPVIVSENVGYFNNIILENNLGFVIKPEESQLEESLLNLYKLQPLYRRNIMKYLSNLKETRVEELIEV